MKESYLTVVGEAEATLVIEKSKFICRIKGVNSEEDAVEFIKRIKKEHSLATHNCYAFIADEYGRICKSSDDGEPSSTAGMPMLDALKNAGFYKVAAVVTRYFGGTKLGTGGLVRAYSSAVLAALDVAQKGVMTLSVRCCLTVDYDMYRKLSSLFGGKIAVLSTEYDEQVKVNLVIPKADINVFREKLNALFGGKVTTEGEEDIYYCFK